jgi:hypothetical protein
MNGRIVAEPRPAQEAIEPEGERRRPGRGDYDNPELIKLLRDSSLMEVGSAADVPRADGKAKCNNAIERDDDDLSAARGILVAALLSLGCWITLGAIVWVV